MMDHSNKFVFSLGLIIFSIAFLSSYQEQSQAAKTPEDWINQFKCHKNATQKSLSKWKRVLFGDQCDRDDSSWRWNYLEEFEESPNRIKVRESLIDERLANGVDTVRTLKTTSKAFAFRFNSGNSSQDELNKQLVAGPMVDDRLCGEHLKQMLDLINDLDWQLDNKRTNSTATVQLDERHIRLARVLDSFGRYDSGYLSGLTFAIGQYDQCVGSQLLIKNSSSASENEKLIGTRYCWAQLNLEKHLHPSLNGNKEKFSNKVFDKNVLSVAICIPNSCHSRSFDANKPLFKQLVQGQFKLPKSIYLEENLDLESVFCLVDEKSDYLEWSLGAKLFAVTMITWTLLAICATVYFNYKIRDTEQKDNEKQGIFACLNLADSWNDLLGNKRNRCQAKAFPVIEEPMKKPNDKIVNLDALNGIKAISWVLIVSGHSLIFVVLYTTDSFRLMSLVVSDKMINSTKIYFSIVNTFFFLSGFLTSYIGIKTLKKVLARNVDEHPKGKGFVQFSSVWFYIALMRFLRVFPLFYLKFWFDKSIFSRLGSGPLWDFGLDATTDIGSRIRTSWLRPFNFFDGYTSYNLQSWYIYSDLYAQILFVPPIVYLLAKGKVKLCYLITVCITVISYIAALYQYSRIDPALDYEFRRLQLSAMNIQSITSIYQEPFYRLPLVLIGVLAGHALYCYEIDCKSDCNQELKTIGSPLQKIPRPRIARGWPNWFKGPATYLAFGYIVISYLLTILIDSRQNLNSYLMQLIILQTFTVLPLLWGLSNAVIFLRLVTDWQHTWLARLGSNQLVKAFNNLGYAIYLTHVEILMFNFRIATSTLNYSSWLWCSTVASTFAFSSLIALFLFVVVENPFDKLRKKLF